MSSAKQPAKKKKNASSGRASSSAARKTTRPARVYTEKHIYFSLFVLCLLQTLVLGGILFFWMSLEIPDLNTVTAYDPAQATIIYDRNGRIVDRMFTENRSVLPLAKMPSYLPQAFVAAEDGRFFEHPGLDFFSVLRALINNFRQGAKSQGGSTITQQVAKSLLLSPEKTYSRKFKEAVLAWQIDRKLRKEEILFIYLNQIYLGQGAFGVEAAAQVYFGKSAGALSLGESALLAGLPQAPSRYSLFGHLDRAFERQKYVLNRMAADGYVSASAAQKAFAEEIRLNRRSQSGGDADGYYLQLVKKRAREYIGLPLQAAEAKIYTSLDSSMQKHALFALQNGVKAARSRQIIAGKKVQKSPQGALVCIETDTARVRALVGGTSFGASPFDRASQAKRPAGSTFKSFVYLAALNRGYSPSSLILDSPLSIKGKGNKVWTPKNYSGRYHGQVSLAEAFAYSLNTATIRLMQKTGYKEVHRLARACGISAKLAPDLSLALGAVDVSPLEMTSAYSVFAGNGSYHPPVFIEKIVLSDGKVLYPETGKGSKQVVDRKSLGQLQSMLAGVVRYGTGKSLSGQSGVRGGKTGTSNEIRDAWFIGFNRKYTTGVWVGYDKNLPMGRGEGGGRTAVPVWKEFMGNQ